MITNSKKAQRRTFVIGKHLEKEPKVDLNLKYRLILEKSFIVSLFALSLLFLFFPKFKAIKKFRAPLTSNVILEIDDIPATRQGPRIPPPLKPVVPIPTEEESIPEDLTIEPTQLNFDYAFGDVPEASDKGIGWGASIAPRPIADVFPEYPKEGKKNGIEGIVELRLRIDIHGNVAEVLVLKNTTNCQKFAEAAVAAAYKTKYTPARRGSRPVSVWVSRIYKFELTG